MVHMKNSPDSSAENALNDLRGGTIQSLVIAGASVTLVVSGESRIFEIGSLGEVELQNGQGDPKDLFSHSVGALSPLAGSQIADISVGDERVILTTENPSWALTFERGIDYAIEIAEVARTKGPAFFFG